ncbi:MAG: hypothetical protein ACJAU0_000596 [Flavobacteriales bacterium]|jgi:hypothetical protein
MKLKTDYPAKVILAWGESISGNAQLRKWLMENGYPELGLFVYALFNKGDARDWLIKNGFPHLMALINGAEGNRNALLWLQKFELTVMFHIAKAADNDDASLHWLLTKGHKEWFVLAQKIRIVKNQIELDNNDVHKISSD